MLEVDGITRELRPRTVRSGKAETELKVVEQSHLCESVTVLGQTKYQGSMRFN